MTCKTLVENALLITLDPARPASFLGWMAIDAAGKILETGSGDCPYTPQTRIDAGGAMVAPGFVSGHSHLSTSGSRGLGHDQPLYGWADHMTRYTRHCDSEDIYWATLHGALDFINNGVTTAYDFCDSRQAFFMEEGRKAVLGPMKPASYNHRQFDAKVDAGLRFVHSIMLNDQVGSDEEIYARFGESLAHAQAAARDDLHLGHAISGAVQWSDTPETARREVEVMRRYGVINQPHFLETPENLDLQRSKFDWYDQAGALGPKLIFGHFIHPTEAMKCRCAACDVAMIWQPSANGRLASGFADIAGLIEKGMRVGVGLDDQSCTDIADPWQNMRMGIYMQRAHRQDVAAMGVPQMLELHTLGSARALGIDDRVGSLEPGKYADFLLVDPLQPDIGPLWDPVASYVLAISLRNLKEVYIGGVCVSREGRSLNPLAQSASQELHQRLGAIAQQIAAAS